MHEDLEVTNRARQPVVRISKGRFAPEVYTDVKKLIDESAIVLVAAIQALTGLLYSHAGVDQNIATVVNVSVWENKQAAKQMDTLPAMLAQRPIQESVGVLFDKIRQL